MKIILYFKVINSFAGFQTIIDFKGIDAYLSAYMCIYTILPNRYFTIVKNTN